MFKRLATWALMALLLLGGGAPAQAQTNSYNVLDSIATAIEANRMNQTLGFVPGYSRVAILGHNPVIGNGAAADVWEGGGNYTLLAAASQLEILSASANDTAAGTGARTVLISGLDANWLVISETLTLNGVTPVQSVNSYLRVNLMTTVTSGSGQVNAGDLTLRVTGGGTTQAIARAGFGFGRQAIYTVPDGFVLYCGSFNFTVLTPSSTVFSAVFGIQQVSGVGNKRIPIEFQVTSNQPYLHLTQFGLNFVARTSVMLRVTLAGQAATNVTAAGECMLIDLLRVRK